MNLLGRIRVGIIQWAIHLNELLIFYPRLKRYYQNLGLSGPTILDVGSNKGQSIAFFRQIFGKAQIFGFEPNPVLFNKLLTEWNSDNKVFLSHVGVSEAPGDLELQITVTDETSTFEPLNPDSDYLKMKAKVLGVKPEEMVVERYRVKVIRLADFIREQQLPRVDILKIDTEGHEYKCLKGLFDGNTVLPEYIQLEVHEDDMYVNREELRQIPELLRTQGYRRDAVIEHGFGNFHEVIYKRIIS
jgi:FkbM family methyltransferase